VGVCSFGYAGQFLENFNSAGIGYILPALTAAFSLSNVMLGWVASIAFLGMLIGAICGGPIADRIGRKKTDILSILIFSVGSVLVMFSWNYDSLVAFRLLQGFGFGAEVPLAITYVSEYSPQRSRSVMVSLCTTFYNVGLTAAGPVSLFTTPTFGWRGMFYVGAPIGFLVIALMILFMPESVRQLIKWGKLDEAERIVRKLSTADPTQVPVKEAPIVAKGKLSDLITGTYLRLSPGCWFTAFAQGLVTGTIMVMMTTIFHAVGMPLQLSVIIATITAGFGIIAAPIGGVLMELIGRRRSLYLGYLGMGICLVATAGTYFTRQIFVMAALVILGYFFSGMNFPSLNTYASEIYPTRIRGTGVSVMQAFQRVGQFTGPMVAAIMLSSVANFFVLIGSFSIAAGIIMFLSVYETRGRSLERVTEELTTAK
jgi:putative MFS transporter